MTPPPACAAMGRQCHVLNVTLRVAALDAGPKSADHEATWLFGHTERMQFGRLRRRGDHLYARASIHVPCRHFEAGGEGPARCRAHGFQSRLPRPAHRPRNRQLGGDQFEYVDRGVLRTGRLAPKPPPARSLPVHAAPNPCATARCKTANHAIGAACCRDLQLEVICPPSNRHLEALLRHRQSPFLCKVDRDEPDSLGVEVISACSFLGEDGRSCVLHDRGRPDGRGAKPDLCFDWPSGNDAFHPGCVFQPAR